MPDASAVDAPLDIATLDRELAMRGWTIPELAEKAGVHPSTLWKMRGVGGRCSRRTKTLIVRALIEHERAPIGEVLLGLSVREPGG